MEDEEEAKPAESAGAPAWMATFADLMSLLMCFFVLMLAFSEMDAQKFKQLSGSMRNAFGVQSDIKAMQMPKGTSLITKEFTPGKPQPTPLRSVRQFTIQSNKNTLKWIDERDKDVRKIKRTLQKEIQEKSVSVEVDGERIIIHIREKASFRSGAADLKPEFAPVVRKLGHLLGELKGEITVAGHTDDIPISTARFRSNWDLSASRAVSVAHELLGASSLEPSRFAVTGHADTKPVASNSHHEGRSKNRRVDITIVRSLEEAQNQRGPDTLVLSAGEPSQQVSGALNNLGTDAQSAPISVPQARTNLDGEENEQ